MRTIEKFNSLADSEIDLKPFINFLVVLIPVLMISAEFSKIAVVEASAVDEGVDGTKRDSVRSQAIDSDALVLTLMVSDSTIMIGTQNGLLPITYYFEHSADFLPGPLSVYDELKSTLAIIKKQAGENAGAARIRIAAENSVIYDKIIQLMDVSREAGFKDISIGRLRG